MRRRDMTYRVVPLTSQAAGDARLGTTAAERLAMVRELSRIAWIAGGRTLPSYARADIRIRLSALRDQGTTEGD